MLLLFLCVFGVASAQDAGRPNTARVLMLAVNAGTGRGGAYYLTCRAVRGSGKVVLNNNVSQSPSGVELVRSFLSALDSLRTDTNLPGGVKADSARFDFNFEIDDQTKIFGGPSAGLAAGLTAYSAMTGKSLRPNLAITGAVSLDGRAGAIGGLDAKVAAAIDAGASILLIPSTNVEEVMDLPFEWRMAVPIFGVTSLRDAIVVGLSPADPAAKGFNTYLAHRQAAVSQLQRVYDQHLRSGASINDVHDQRPDLERVYRSYFATVPDPSPAGKAVDDLDGLLRRYPWDVGLASVLPIAKRVRLNIVAASAASDGDKQFASGNFKMAYDAYRKATELNPAASQYFQKLFRAGEEHFTAQFRPQVDEADHLYNDRQFESAAMRYGKLAALAKEYQTRFPMLERLAQARGRAAAAPTDAALRRAAARTAVDTGFLADAVDEYRTLVRTEPKQENLTALVQTAFDAATRVDKPDYDNAVRQAVAETLETSKLLKPVEAANVQQYLAGMASRYRLHRHAIQRWSTAVTYDPGTSNLMGLSRAHLDYARTLTGQPRRDEFTNALNVLRPISEQVLRDEALYALRELIDREVETDSTPPFIQLSQSKPKSDGTLSGTIAFNLALRDASGVARVELATEKRVLRSIDCNNDRRDERVFSLDTRDLPNGDHKLVISALDTKGNRNQMLMAVRISNKAPSRVVWASPVTKRYHLPTCPSAPKEGERLVVTEPGAQAGGYKPCLRCIKLE